MNASSASLTRLGRTKSLVLAALVAAFGMLALAGTSKAAEHTITLDNGKVNLGAVFTDATVIPAPVATADCPTVPPYNGTDTSACGPSPLSPLKPNTDANGSIKVDVTGANATVAAGDFTLPTMYLTNPTAQPTDPSYYVPVDMSAPNGLSGTFTEADGSLELTGDLRIEVFTGAHGSVDPDQPPNPVTNPPVFETCQMDLPNGTWSTGLNSITPGVPFTGGLDGDGAIAVQWPNLPAGQEMNGGDCSTVNAVVAPVEGALWISSGIATPPEAPKCEEPLEGLWPDCFEPEPEPNPQAKITAVKLFPKKRALRAGKNLKLKVRVVNKGDKGKWVTVKLKVNRKKGVRLRKQVKIWAKPGTFSQKKVPFKTNRRKARGKYRITARGAGKMARSVVTVKPVKKKKRRR